MKPTDKIFVKVKIQECSLNGNLKYVLASEVIFDDKDCDEIFEIIKETGVLSDLECKICAMRVCGYTLREIGKEVNKHSAVVHDIFVKSIDKLRDYYQSHPCYLDWEDVYMEEVYYAERF